MALDRAMARAAARNAALPPMSALRAACLATYGTRIPTALEGAAPVGRPADAMHVSAARHDEHARVVHVATVRDIPSRHGWYRVRIWRELSELSAN